MIVQTTQEINGVVYAYTYSDSGFMIERDGVEYSEAIDPIDTDRMYEESTTPLADEEATAEDYRASLAELGVSV